MNTNLVRSIQTYYGYFPYASLKQKIGEGATQIYFMSRFTANK